jgi:hypothetical protein
MLDLGVFLPATVATCVGLVHGSAWAPKALYLVAGWFGVVGLAVAAMAIAMYLNNDPNASAANAAFMTILGLAFAMLALTLYWPLFGGRADKRGQRLRIRGRIRALSAAVASRRSLR